MQLHWHLRLTAPQDSDFAGHTKATGWMTAENFLGFMKHFVKYTKSCSQQPILLLLDNHNITFVNENYITLLSFPPHFSHELQPLDKSAYGPFKTYINQASKNRMRQKENAGKSMSIHAIPSLVSYV